MPIPDPLPPGPAAPNPTSLTQDAIDRSADAERDFVKGEIKAIVQRFEDLDEATRVLHETVTRIPTDVQQAVGHLRELMDEKFASVATQFAERDTRSERESRDNKVAVDAAFAAQKEAAAKEGESNQKAIDKSEKATNETIDKLGQLFESSNKALSDKIDDLKGRVGNIEGRGVGASTQITRTQASVGVVVGVIAGIVGVLGLLVTIAVVIANHG